MSKHSPGPWTLSRDPRPHMEWNITVVRQDNPNLAVCFMTSDGPNEANAKLIAAAPELLSALTELLESGLALMPPAEAGKEAQDAWADRRAKARTNAALLIDRLS